MYLRDERTTSLSFYGMKLNQDTYQDRMHSYTLFARNELSSFVDKWQSYRKTVNFLEAQYRIVIDAKTDFPGSLAIDNLKFANGPCAEVINEEKFCDFDAIVGSANETDMKCEWIQFCSPSDIGQ